MKPHRIAEADMSSDLAIDLDVMIKPYSIVVDLNGVAFYHRAI